MTRDDIIERIACAVTAQGCVMRDLSVHVVDFAPSARGFLVLVGYVGMVHIKMDLDERDELWAKWHENSRRAPALTVSGAAG